MAIVIGLKDTSPTIDGRYVDSVSTYSDAAPYGPFLSSCAWPFVDSCTMLP